MTGNPQLSTNEVWVEPETETVAVAETVPPAVVERQQALQAELSSLIDVVGPAPLVDVLLERAFEFRATDVHLDPRDDGLHVRIRLDGILHDVLTLAPQLAPQIVSRIKLLAGMDITERRLAQDGHISSSALRHRRDVRVGSGPTIYGERLVLRLMPDSETLSHLDELGLEDDQSRVIRRVVQSSYGMVLCAGPVGCGKSTTTYACLGLLNDPGLSLTTIEDPVERRIAGVNQIQVEPKIRFGFPEALRGVLRQDPDVMMVGEIRDPETAHIAVRAGLTGIRVLSTLHAGTTASVIDVFREFDIPPMFIADAVKCIIAQRLLRKVCPDHREEYRPDAATIETLGVPAEQAATIKLQRGLPAPDNFHTGYSGRTGIFEVMRIDDAIRQAILDGRACGEIHHLAVSRGMLPLDRAAARKVLAGITSVEEMHRVLMAE
jgi:type II secretory ATPase GspE/PulE/Tfp pilus assembly ATPase PilB-like protein